MSDYNSNSTRVWNFAFSGFIFMTVVICSGVSVIIPVIPNIMRNFGVESNFISAAFVTLLAGRFLSSLFTGYLLFRFRPHHLLFFSFSFHMVTMVLLMFSKTGLAFAVLRFAEGIFEGMVSVLLQVIVIAMSKPEDRGVKMGYMQSAFGMGFIFGPVLGGISMQLFGPQGVFGVTAGLMGICIIWLTLTFRQIRQHMNEVPAKPLSLSFEFVRYIPYYGGPILQRVLVVAFAMLLPLYLVDNFGLGSHQVGYYFTMSAIITTTTMPFTGRLGNHRHCNYIVTAAMVFMGLSILGMSLTSSKIVFTVLFVLETIAFAVMAPNAMKIFGDKVADHHRRNEIIGTASSFRELVNIALAFCLIPLYEFNMLVSWVLLTTFCVVLSLPYLKSSTVKIRQ